MARGRSAAVHADTGRRLEAAARAHFAPLLASRPVRNIDQNTAFNSQLWRLAEEFAA